MIEANDVVIGMQAPAVQQVVRDYPTTMQRPPRRGKPQYVSGARGLSRYLDIPLGQAEMMLNSGVIEDAVKRNGPDGVVIIDILKALELWQAACDDVTGVEEE